jgi:hypothetical protein
MKKSILLGIILSLLISSCGSILDIATVTGVKEESLNTIPKGARTIVVIKPGVSADSLYEELFTVLLSRGHRILKEDKVRHYITTEGKDIGMSTLQRMTLVITDFGSNATLKINSEWKAGAEASLMASGISGLNYNADWASATWEISKLGIAFAEGLAVAQGIKNSSITFEM